MRFYMFYKWQQSGHEVIEIFSTLQALQHDEMGDSLGFPDPDAPWCWYIYLHDWVIFGVNVGIHIPAPWVAYGRIASTSGTSLMIFFRHGFQNHIESSQVNFHELPRNFASEVIPWLWTPNGSPTGPDPQGELTPSGLTRRSSCTLPTDTWRSSQQVGDRFMVGLMVGLQHFITSGTMIYIMV